MPKHDATRSDDNAANKQARIKFLVDMGIGYGEAQAIDDTALHAVSEALSTLMGVVDRNAGLLNLSMEGRTALAICSLKLLSGSIDYSLSETAKDALAIIKRAGR